MRNPMIVATVFGCAWLMGAASASSQTARSLDAARPQHQRQYYATYSSPTVSPYVNLGINSNGLSNYQTLVRPMIEERAAIQQQSAALEQLNQRIRGASNHRDRRNAEGSESRPQPAVRFMDYSRYFGTTW